MMSQLQGSDHDLLWEGHGKKKEADENLLM